MSQFFLDKSLSQISWIIEIKTAPRVDLDSIFVEIVDPAVDLAHALCHGCKIQLCFNCLLSEVVLGNSDYSVEI